MKIRLLFFLVALWFFFLSPAHSDEFTGTASRWPVIQTQSIAVSETHVFVGDGDTLNIYNKETMEREAYLRLDNVSEGFRALIYDPDEKYLYAACGYSGVQTINVDSPENPVLGYEYLTSDQPAEDTDVIAFDIALHDSYLFVADRNYCMRILDISEPDSPREAGFKNFATMSTPIVPMKVGIYSTAPLADVWAILIVTSDNSASAISRFKISDFDKSTLSIAETGYATGLPTFFGVSSFLVEGGYAYCVDNYYNDIYVFGVGLDNLEDGLPDLIFAQMNDDDYKDDNPLKIVNPRGLFKLRDYIYITNHGYWTEENEEPYGFTTLDFQTLFDEDGQENAAPEFVTGLSLSGTNSIVVEDESEDGVNAFVTSTFHGFAKVNPDRSKEFAETMINAHHIAIEKETGFIYVCDNRASTDTEEHGITILRAKPETVSEEDPDTGVETTTIIRYSYPALPMREQFFWTPGTAKASCFAPALDYAYVADGNEGIQILDLSTTEVDGDDGPGHPTMISDSNIPAPAGYEVFDVSVDELPVAGATYLMALTTDPSGELWVVNVTEATTEDEPITYTHQTVDLDGDTAAKNVCAYHYNDNLYALVARGTDGLTIIHLNPDWENPQNLEIPPQEDQIMSMDFANALRVYVNNRNDVSPVNKTYNYAYVANGADGVGIIQLFDETNLATMNPALITTIDTSDYGSAIDVHIYANSVGRFLYVLTDNPYKAVLLYDIGDIENPVFKGYTATSGKSSGIWATQMMFTSNTSVTGSGTIRGVFIADGPGGVAFRGVTPETEENERDWPDDSSKFCFISALQETYANGLIPVCRICFFSLGTLLCFALSFLFSPKKEKSLYRTK